MGPDGWVPRSTNEGPSGKDKDLVKASSRWCKRSAPLWHLDKWSTCLWKKLTDGGCTHPSSTKHSYRLVYRRNTLTADVCIRHQQGTPTRWGLAISTDISYLDKNTDTLHLNNDIITRAAGLLFPRLFRNNSIACGQSNGATIQANVFDTTRRSWYD